MTRARHQLWLSAYVWSATRKKHCAVSPFLAEVVALGDATVIREEWAADPVEDEVNPLTAEGVADIAWPVPHDSIDLARREAAAELVAAAQRRDRGVPEKRAGGVIADSWRRDSSLLLDEIRRRRSRIIDVAVPARLTTSQVVALAQDADAFAAAIARPVPLPPVSQARRGSRFHQWVEQLFDASPLLEPDDLPGNEDADLDDAELASLQQKFRDSGWADRRPIIVEAPFETVVGGRLIRGRIDAVYSSDDGGYDVIDYKTGAVLTGKDFEAASYQLSIYRLAWADLAGVDPASVSAGFLYVREGLLKRPGRLLDRDELAALLTAA
jgi:DNA helicase-2/ATP-dependent DNA helicase PcrA